MLRDYLVTIVIVSAIVGLISFLGKSRSVASEKLLRYVASLAMIIVLVAPFARIDLSALSDEAERSILDVMNGGGDLDSSARDRLKGYGAAALAEYTDGELAVRAKLPIGAATSAFTLAENDAGEWYIVEIDITLRTLASIAKRDTIEAYLLAVYGANPKINFHEQIGGVK